MFWKVACNVVVLGLLSRLLTGSGDEVQAITTILAVLAGVGGAIASGAGAVAGAVGPALGAVGGAIGSAAGSVGSALGLTAAPTLGTAGAGVGIGTAAPAATSFALPAAGSLTSAGIAPGTAALAGPALASAPSAGGGLISTLGGVLGKTPIGQVGQGAYSGNWGQVAQGLGRIVGGGGGQMGGGGGGGQTSGPMAGGGIVDGQNRGWYGPGQVPATSMQDPRMALFQNLQTENTATATGTSPKQVGAADYIVDNVEEKSGEGGPGFLSQVILGPNAGELTAGERKAAIVSSLLQGLQTGLRSADAYQRGGAYYGPNTIMAGHAIGQQALERNIDIGNVESRQRALDWQAGAPQRQRDYYRWQRQYDIANPKPGAARTPPTVQAVGPEGPGVYTRDAVTGELGQKIGGIYERPRQPRQGPGPETELKRIYLAEGDEGLRRRGLWDQWERLQAYRKSGQPSWFGTPSPTGKGSIEEDLF